MKIINVKYDLPMTKYDTETFLFLKGFVAIEFEDEITQSTLLLNITNDIILDGASIPPMFRWLFKTNYDNMDYNIPWIVHDLLYVFGSFSSSPMSFKQSNQMFLALMEYYKKPTAWERKAEYKAVSSCFGRKCYDTENKYDKNNKPNIEWSWI